LKYRQNIERAVVSGFRAFYRGSEANLQAKAVMQKSMAEKLARPGLEDIRKNFIPEWSPGCRRLTPGEGYLEALARENVKPTFEGILRITPNGILTKTGVEYEADIIACATGFDIQFTPHFNITGVNGLVMQDGEPNVYASIACPGFPNYFVVNGPRGNWSQGAQLPSHDVQIEYIMQMCRKLQQDGIKSLMPKADVTTQMNLYMDAWHRKHSVWAENCRSWYKVSHRFVFCLFYEFMRLLLLLGCWLFTDRMGEKQDNKPDGRIYTWPGSLLHHLKYLKTPRFEHYDMVYQDPGNIFAFLGNGLTVTETKFSPETLPVPYIRNDEDEAWDIE
jgi:hypothetical protein